MNNEKNNAITPMDEFHEQCCICMEPFIGWGNNPYPVSGNPEEVCCDRCDNTVVANARRALVRAGKW